MGQQGLAENEHDDLRGGDLARQTQDRLTPDSGQDGRLAGADGHAVGQDFAVGERFQDLDGQVARADGAAAGDEDRVVVLQAVDQGRGEGLAPVRDQPQGLDPGPGLSGHAGQGVGIDVPDLAGPGRALHGHQFVAGGDDAAAGTAENPGLQATDGGHEAHVLRPDAPAGRQGHLPRSHVLAPQHDVLARRHGLADLHGGIPEHLGVLDHDHGVRAGRQASARGDAHALAGREGAADHLVDGRAAGELHIGGVAFAGAEGVRRPQGVAVHAGPVQGRDVLAGLDVFGQHPPQAVIEGQGFRRHGRERGEQSAEPLRGDDPEKTVIHAYSPFREESLLSG